MEGQFKARDCVPASQRQLEWHSTGPLIAGVIHRPSWAAAAKVLEKIDCSFGRLCFALRFALRLAAFERACVANCKEVPIIGAVTGRLICREAHHARRSVCLDDILDVPLPVEAHVSLRLGPLQGVEVLHGWISSASPLRRGQPAKLTTHNQTRQDSAPSLPSCSLHVRPAKRGPANNPASTMNKAWQHQCPDKTGGH